MRRPRDSARPVASAHRHPSPPIVARQPVTRRDPEKIDQIAARKRKGSAGGRPGAFDPDAYKDRNVVERSFALAKLWRGITTRDDKLAAATTTTTYRAGAVLHACLTWAAPLGDMS